MRYGKIALIQILAGAWAGLVFGLLPWRQVAGVVAALGFLTWNTQTFRLLKSEYKKSFLFYFNIIFLIGVTLPMFIGRLTHWDLPFDKIYIWGLAGPKFHLLSTTVYKIQLAVVVVEGCYKFWRGKK